MLGWYLAFSFGSMQSISGIKILSQIEIVYCPKHVRSFNHDSLQINTVKLQVTSTRHNSKMSILISWINLTCMYSSIMFLRGLVVTPSLRVCQSFECFPHLSLFFSFSCVGLKLGTHMLLRVIMTTDAHCSWFHFHFLFVCSSPSLSFRKKKKDLSLGFPSLLGPQT